MMPSSLRQAALLGFSLALAACGARDGSSPQLPTASGNIPGAPTPVGTGKSADVFMQSSAVLPAGFVPQFRVDPRPDADGAIHGDAPLSVTFDMCGSRPDGGKTLFYLFDWDFDSVADVTGTECQQTHQFRVRANAPDGNLEANVCVVDGDPSGPRGSVFFACRAYRISLPAPPTALLPCAQFELRNGSARGSTVGVPNSNNPSCGASHSSDRSYQFTAPVAGLYAFDTIGSSYDTVLSVRTGCPGAELACNDDHFGLQSQVIVSLERGQTVIVEVDGFSTASGNYTLNVQH